jgi:hypothetical protein
VAGVVTVLALLAASVAWVGWVYLRTVADPARSSRIAHAILGDPLARREVTVGVSDSIATAANKSVAARRLPLTVDGADPSLRAAVDAALSDPRIAANVLDAITAEHAEALGATPPHPAAVNTALLLAAVRAHLAPVDPQLAGALPALAPAQVRLPAVKIPYAGQARRWAEHWAHVLALGALAGLLLALLVGDRAAVLRRWGVWAIGAALSWAVLPPLAVWAGDTWAKSHAAVVRAVARGATAGVTAAAVVLVVGGTVAVVTSYVLPRLEEARWRAGAHARGARPAGAPPVAPVPPAQRGAVAPGRAGSPAAAAAAASTWGWSTDPWAPSGPPTDEVPVLDDRTGKLTSRPPVGPAAPALPAPPPRPARRRGVSPPLLGRAGDDPGELG